MRRTAFALALALLLPALPAHAVELGSPKTGQALLGANLKINNTFYTKWNVFLDDDPDDDILAGAQYQTFFNRLRADLQIKQFSVGAQLDMVALAPLCTGSECGLQPNLLGGPGWPADANPLAMVELEKVWAKYQGKTVQIELGDFYASFGRGIVLALLKKPEIDQDNSLRGARFDLLTKPVDFTFLGGITNPSQISAELRNTAIRTDPLSPGSLILGGQLRVRPGSGWTLGMHGVGYDLLDDETKGTIGGTLEANGLFSGGLDFYLEGNGLFHKKAQADLNSGQIVLENRTGYMLYGVVNAYLGALTLTVEGKRYKDAQILQRDGPVTPLQYVLPPTLEHEASVTEDVNAAIQSNDITGFRARGDLWFLQSDTTAWASFAGSVDDTPVQDFNDEREVMIHPQIGIDQPIHLSDAVLLHINADVGYRHDFPVHNDADTSNFLTSWGLLHFRTDIGVTVGDHSWELVSTYRRQHRTIAAEECWTLEGAETCSGDTGWVSVENALSYTIKGSYTFAVHVDYTDDNIVQQAQTNGSIGNLHYDRLWQASTYLGGEIILKPVTNLEIAIFGGSQKAGIVCTGGACRNVPAFTGVKGKVSVNF